MEHITKVGIGEGREKTGVGKKRDRGSRRWKGESEKEG